jgi:hypothetical protein
MRVPVRIHHRGSHAVVAEGPARWLLYCEVCDEAGQTINLPRRETPLPSMLLPGQVAPTAVTVPIPDRAGAYQVYFRAKPAQHHDAGTITSSTSRESSMRLQVKNDAEESETRLFCYFQEAIQEALAEAEKLQRLPDDYHDVTEGWLATWKRRIKSKLLHNFRRAYVDVLSRQQSGFNRQVITILQEIMECTAVEGQAIQDELARSRQRIAELEERLGRLETILLAREPVST